MMGDSHEAILGFQTAEDAMDAGWKCHKGSSGVAYFSHRIRDYTASYSEFTQDYSGLFILCSGKSNLYVVRGRCLLPLCAVAGIHLTGHRKMVIRSEDSSIYPISLFSKIVGL